MSLIEFLTGEESVVGCLLKAILEEKSVDYGRET